MSEKKIPTIYNGKPIQKTSKSGKQVKVSPCSDKYQNKTYKGIFVGTIPFLISDMPVLQLSNQDIVLGCECWWELIKDDEVIIPITEEDIRTSIRTKFEKRVRATKNKEMIAEFESLTEGEIDQIISDNILINALNHIETENEDLITELDEAVRNPN